MSIYYIVHKITREVIRRSDTPFNINENVQPPDPHLQLKRMDDDTIPAFNPNTHKLVKTFIDDDTLFTRTYQWIPQPLTQTEIDDRIEAQQGENIRQQIKAEYLNLKNGVGTTAERAARLEKAVAWLLRQQVKN